MWDFISGKNKSVSSQQDLQDISNQKIICSITLKPHKERYDMIQKKVISERKHCGEPQQIRQTHSAQIKGKERHKRYSIQ